MADTNKYHLELARRYLDEGDEDRARQIVLARRLHPTEDAEIHFQWAQLCEELGMAEQARESYRRALRISPTSSESLFRYACLLMDTGYYEEAVHYLKKVISSKPDHHEAKKLLAENYHLLGFEGLAEALHPRPRKEVQPVRYFPPSIGKEDVQRFLSLFSGREVGYSLQKVDQEKGNLHYEYQAAPLTPELVSKHINGELTLAGYPLRKDKTVKWAVVEIRLRKKTIESNIKNIGYLSYLRDRAFEGAEHLRKAARQHGLPGYIDYSGEYGYRLWFFFSEFNHFLKIRDFLKGLIEGFSAPDNNLLVDPLMPTKGVGIGWVERPFVLPFGLNRATLKRYQFLDEAGKPFPEQLIWLKKVREIPLKEAIKALRKGYLPLSVSAQRGLTVLVDKLMRSCPVLSELARKAGSGRGLTHDERVILFYTVGLVDPDGIALHTILEPCPDYNYQKVERQRLRLKPNPVSCLKIRERAPELTASVLCNCSFDLRGGKYPSPLLHINPNLVPTSKDLEIPDRMPLSEAAERYVNLKRQRVEIEKAMKRIENFLESQFHKKGLEKIRIGRATLYRKENDGLPRWEIEVSP